MSRVNIRGLKAALIVMFGDDQERFPFVFQIRDACQEGANRYSSVQSQED